MTSLRAQCLALLAERDPGEKCRLTRGLDLTADIAPGLALEATGALPGLPDRPALFAKLQFKKLSLRTVEGRSALVHSLAHIELNAVNLALDIVWRFPGMPAAFYLDWAQVAKEEALHFELLRDHLRAMDHDYGDFPAHTGLWDMAERTRHDLVARLALVPRTLEARGLDASPAVRAKLVGAGDRRAGEILDIILRDEIGHVAVGNKWYRHECARRGLDPVAIYAGLAERYEAPRLRAPFNLAARRAAGFEEAELVALQNA